MGLAILYQVLGWVAFAAWSFSFYPQVLLNYKRKRSARFLLRHSFLANHFLRAGIHFPRPCLDLGPRGGIHLYLITHACEARMLDSFSCLILWFVSLLCKLGTVGDNLYGLY